MYTKLGLVHTQSVGHAKSNMLSCWVPFFLLFKLVYDLCLDVVSWTHHLDGRAQLVAHRSGCTDGGSAAGSAQVKAHGWGRNW